MPLSINNFYNYVFLQKAIALSKVPEVKKQEVLLKQRQQLQAYFCQIKEKKYFRALLREKEKIELEDALYGDHTTPLDPAEPWPSSDAIQIKFKSLDAEYGYFENDSEAESIFEKFFFACKLIADFSEENNTPSDDLAYLNAYKCMVLFGWNAVTPLKNTADFIKQHGVKYEKPVHDVLVYNIPNNDLPIHLKEWQKLIKKSGLTAIRLFQQASAIEAVLKQQAPRTLTEAQEAASHITYKRAEEYPELAELCLQYNVTEPVFNRCLAIKPKKTDALPDVIIDGATVDYPGYYLLKLPFDDPRAFILGHLTNCCQSIGGDAEKSVIDGVTRPKTGFYVLLKAKDLQSKPLDEKDDEKTSAAPPLINKKINYAQYKIVGQGLLWESWTKNLTFDSWENLTPSVENKVILPMLEAFAKEVTSHGDYMRVTIGLGGKTPAAFRSRKIDNAEIIDEGYQYADSLTQALVYINQEKSSKLAELISNKYDLKAILSSTKQAEFLETLFSESNVQFYQRSLSLKNHAKFFEDATSNIFLLAIYYYLHQGKLLNDANLEKMGNYQKDKQFNSKALVSIASVLRTLFVMSPKLITDKTVNSLFRQERIVRIKMQALNMYRVSLSLPHPSIIELILDTGKYAVEGVTIIIPLTQVNPKLVLNNLKLLNENSYMLSSMVDIIPYLANNAPQIMTDTTLKTIVNDPSFFSSESLGHFVEVREILEIVSHQNKGFVDQQLFNLIANSRHQNAYEKFKYKYQEQVVAILKIFEAANSDLIDKRHLKKIFSIDGVELIHVRNALETLSSVNMDLITRENVDLLLEKHKFSMNSAISLEVLNNHHLVNVDNLHLLLTKIQSAPLVAQILLYINLNNIPLDRTLYAALENEKELNGTQVTKRLADKLNKMGIFLNKPLEAKKASSEAKPDSPKNMH
jgi:hypothetical protein